MIKVIIIDDEELARDGVKLLLENEHDVEVIADCCDGIEAVAQINELQPDLIFLDINMPGKNGLEVLASIEPGSMPSVIFLTAYNDYAIEAFEVNALDYLLKPVHKERFQTSLQRARLEIDSRTAASREEKISQLLRQLAAAGEQAVAHVPERIMIRTSGHVYFLKAEEIIRVEAEGDYVSVHTRDKSHLIRETMKAMEEKLSCYDFQRIHRSSIVNIGFIRELLTNDCGEYSVVLDDGTSLRLGRSYKEDLYSKLQG